MHVTECDFQPEAVVYLYDLQGHGGDERGETFSFAPAHTQLRLSTPDWSSMTPFIINLACSRASASGSGVAHKARGKESISGISGQRHGPAAARCRWSAAFAHPPGLHTLQWQCGVRDGRCSALAARPSGVGAARPIFFKIQPYVMQMYSCRLNVPTAPGRATASSTLHARMLLLLLTDAVHVPTKWAR